MTRRCFTAIRRPLSLSLATMAAAIPLILSACDKTASERKTSTTTTTTGPEGTKKTTETTDKKVETAPK
jgi:hypothetical protein